MTEEEWHSRASNPGAMVEHLAGEVSARKLRLFGCACLRLVAHRLRPAESVSAIEVAERFADHLATRDELESAEAAALEAVSRQGEGHGGAEFVAYRLCVRPISCQHTSWLAESVCSLLPPDQQDRPCLLAREVFGNPFRPPALEPIWTAWQGGLLRQLARGIYEERAFDRLPVLGDALEEAGCADEVILAHCRQGGAHVRGCWVVDLALGRS
jgi:hypothetical protein